MASSHSWSGLAQLHHIATRFRWSPQKEELDLYSRNRKRLSVLSIADPGRERSRQPDFSDETIRSQRPGETAGHTRDTETVREAADTESAWLAALQVPHPLNSRSVRLESDLEAAIRHICDLKEVTVEWRRLRMEQISIIAGELRPLSEKMRTFQLPTARWAAEGTHVAFLACILDAIDWPDQTFALESCISGMSVLGRAQDHGLWPLRSEDEISCLAAEAMPVEELQKSNVRWNRHLRASLEGRFATATSSGDSAYLAECTAAWDASIKEAESGLADFPISFSRADKIYGYASHRLSPRFIVHQDTKDRPCDNCKISKVNKTYYSPERLVMQRADFNALVGKRFYEIAEDEGWIEQLIMGSGGDDEPDAYRNVPQDDSRMTLVALVDPADGKVKVIRVRGHIFGLSAAVMNFSRKSTVLSATARRFLAAIIGSYLDDYCSPEPSFARGPHDPSAIGGSQYPLSSQGALWFFTDLFNWRLSGPKHQPWSQVATNTGVVTDFTELLTHGHIRLRIKEKTKLKAIRLIDSALTVGSLAPNEAAKLYGKIRWVLSLGPAGRAATQPIKARQYEQGDGPWSLPDDLHAALTFLSGLLEGEIPDSILRCSRRARRHIIIFSDASYHPREGSRVGSGRVAFVVAIPRPDSSGYLIFFAWEKVPVRVLLRLLELREQHNLICPLEEIALVAPYLSRELAPSFKGADVLHFADNTAANAAAIKGYSSAPDLAHLVASLHLTLARGPTRFWLEFVRSRANIADAPSRDDGDLSLLESLGARRIPFTIPSLYGWEGGPEPAGSS